jgi:alcohol dehydrogenase (cytochrome c)
MPANPYWISYGNGPRNWFTNRAETKLTVENAGQLVEKWRLTEGQVTSPPAIIGDRAYIVTASGTIAVNPDTGEKLWPAPAPASGTAAPAYDEATMTLFVGDTRGNLHSIDAMTGMVKWTKRVGMQANAGFCPPVLSGSRVIIGVSGVPNGSTFKGALVAFDKDTGEQLWSYTTTTTGATGELINTIQGAGTMGGAAAVSEGRVIFGTGFSYPFGAQAGNTVIGLGLP